MKKQILSACSVLVLSLSVAVDAQAISKCKDDAGKWHYGDNVSHLCKTNKIVKLNKRGVVKGKIDRKKTQEEVDSERLAQEELEREEAKAREITAAERNARNRILASYEETADIEKVRNEKLAAYKQRNDMFDAYIEYLETKKTVLVERKGKTKTEAAIAALDKKVSKVEKEISSSKDSQEEVNKGILEVNKHYDRELVLFVEFSEGN